VSSFAEPAAGQLAVQLAISGARHGKMKNYRVGYVLWMCVQETNPARGFNRCAAAAVLWCRGVAMVEQNL
jgi:hypothetical protein